MAKAARSAVMSAMAAVALIGGSRAMAAETTDADVVLHVTSYEGIPAAEMIAAQQAVLQVYGRIGVRIAWAGGVAAEAAADRARHIDVILLTAAMADRKQPNASAFGQASHVSGRAYIYPTRVFAYASRTSSDPALVLGLVLAHEIGHVLLPEHSHPSGVWSHASAVAGASRRDPWFSPRAGEHDSNDDRSDRRRYFLIDRM